MSITRDQFLAFTPPAPRPVDVPDLGVVHVRVLTARERERFEQVSGTKPNAIRATLVAFAACDEAGNLLFGPEDIDALNEMPLPVIYRIHEEAVELNKIGQDKGEQLQGN